jgi:prephenate dehydratase
MNHFPTVTIEQMGSTAQGAQKVADHPEKRYAAIGSRAAAEQFGLTIVQENIQSISENETRFWVMGNQPLNRSLI